MRFSYPPNFEYDNEPAIWQNPFEFRRTIQILKSLQTTSLLEIGTGYGLFAKHLMDICHIFVASIDKSPLDGSYPNMLIRDSQTDESFNWAKKVAETSTYSGKFDVVYIDGAHDYESVLSDLKMYTPLAKKAVMFHDVDGNQSGKYPVKLGPYVVWKGLEVTANTMRISARRPENCGVGIILL